MRLLPLVLLGCTDLGLPSESDLDRLRLLAVRTTPAEASPGETVSFEALTYGVGGHEVGRVWSRCGTPFDCPGTELRDTAAEQIALGTAQPDRGIFAVQPGIDPEFRVPVDVLEFLEVPQRLEGIEISFGIIAVDLETEEEEWARKALPISDNPESNLNPVLEAIEIDGQRFTEGEVFTVGLDEGVTLDAVAAEGAEQVYTYIDSDGVAETRTEELSYSWYTDLGDIGGRGSDGFGPRRGNDAVEGDWASPSVGGEGVLILVARDGRGGTGWLRVDVVVE